MNWRVKVIMMLDWIDHRVLRHPSYRLCRFIGSSPFWSLATLEQIAAHERRTGLPQERRKESA